MFVYFHRSFVCSFVRSLISQNINMQRLLIPTLVHIQSVSLARVTPASGLVLAEPPLEAFTWCGLAVLELTKFISGECSAERAISNLLST